MVQKDFYFGYRHVVKFLLLRLAKENKLDCFVFFQSSLTKTN